MEWPIEYFWSNNLKVSYFWHVLMLTIYFGFGHFFLLGAYTEWPRENATTLIVNFKNIVDETEWFFILFGRAFIFQQNDTMIISLGKVSGL